MKLTVTTVRRQSASVVNTQVHCPACQSETETLSLKESARLLDMETSELEDLIGAGIVHVLGTGAEDRTVCVNSLSRPGDGPGRISRT
jgi:hypothetical protein